MPQSDSPVPSDSVKQQARGLLSGHWWIWFGTGLAIAVLGAAVTSRLPGPYRKLVLFPIGAGLGIGAACGYLATRLGLKTNRLTTVLIAVITMVFHLATLGLHYRDFRDEQVRLREQAQRLIVEKGVSTADPMFKDALSTASMGERFAKVWFPGRLEEIGIQNLVWAIVFWGFEVILSIASAIAANRFVSSSTVEPVPS